MAALPPDAQGPNRSNTPNQLSLVSPKIAAGKENYEDTPPTEESSSPKKRVAMPLLAAVDDNKSLPLSKPPLQQHQQPPQQEPARSAAAEGADIDASRERLKRHRREMAGRVWIPEAWGKETFLKDWKDCTEIDRALFPTGLLLAREALVDECRRRATTSPSGAAPTRSTFRIGNSC